MGQDFLKIPKSSIGRIQRSGKPPVIFDYRDSRIDHFEKMFTQRMRYYRRLQKA